MYKSRIIKLVALLSSSINNRLLPLSTASIIFAACDVEPEACSVEKFFVLPFGNQRINGEILTFLTLLPSSADIFIAESSVITYSLPSPIL